MKSDQGKSFKGNCLEMYERIDGQDEGMKQWFAGYEKTYRPKGTHWKLSHFV